MKVYLYDVYKEKIIELLANRIMDNISSITNLEANILLTVWEGDTVTNREVYEAFLKEEAISKKIGFIPYTTILSTMNGLVRKKILRIDRSKKNLYLFCNSR